MIQDSSVTLQTLLQKYVPPFWPKLGLPTEDIKEIGQLPVSRETHVPYFYPVKRYAEAFKEVIDDDIECVVIVTHLAGILSTICDIVGGFHFFCAQGGHYVLEREYVGDKWSRWKIVTV